MKVWVFGEGDEPVEADVMAVQLSGKESNRPGMNGFYGVPDSPPDSRESWYQEHVYATRDEAMSYRQRCLLATARELEARAQGLREEAKKL